MNKKYTILYVDDETSNLHVFKNTFRRDYNIFTAESAMEGMKILDRENVDLILTDQRMPEMSGVDFLKRVLLKYPEPSRILITAYTDFDALKDAVNDAKIFQYIQKPWEEKEIKQTIDSALEIYYLKQKNLQLNIELKQNNEELVRLNQELIELDKIKFQFLQIISHEIRTPLNGLVGVTNLFKEIAENEDFLEYKELYDLLSASVQKLTNFMLMAQRITAFKTGEYKINPEVVDVNVLINKVVENIRGRLIKKNIKVNIDLCKEGSCECLIEKQLIKICLVEILNNAIKYSDNDGIIKIRTGIENEELFIDIEDDGPGFSADVMKNIFKPFIADEDITKQGMGLNLTLIRLILEAHNGTIRISNNGTKGSIVRLLLKLYRGG